jgi:hypothetical protein
MEKLTKKRQQELQAIEKRVSEVCDTKKTTEVTPNDDGVLFYKETGKPYFEELLEHINQSVEDEIEICLSYGYGAPSIESQLIEQGFKFKNELIVESELIRSQILSLNAIGILNKKGTFKAFAKLNDHIGQTIADSMCKKNETAIKVKK